MSSDPARPLREVGPSTARRAFPGARAERRLAAWQRFKGVSNAFWSTSVAEHGGTDLLGVARDVLQDVCVTLDTKVETPVFRHPCLPAVFAFVVLFGAERRVTEVLAESLAASLCRAATNSPWFEKALDMRLSRMSASALSRRASMMRRCSGVYSSSAAGNLERSVTSLGVMTILPRRKAKLTRSPLDRPAWRRTLVGMVTWPLFWILPVVFMKTSRLISPAVRIPDFLPVA